MIKDFEGHKPRIHVSAYVSEQALIIGKVMLDASTSVWPGSVLRGDLEEILVREDTNLQDGVMVHTSHGHPAVIGQGVTVGHGAIIHGCLIGNNCLIGMGAVILDGAVIGENCLIGAGSVVTENDHIPAGSLAVGVPAKVSRKLTEEEIKKIARSALEYKEFARLHRQSSNRLI